MIQWFFTTMQTYPEIAIFLTLALGYYFGKFTFKGIGLGAVTATLLAGVLIGQIGITISQPLKATAVFPPMVVQMIGVGEATGALDTMLSKIADFYEEEVDVAVAGLLTLMEPLMIAVLGGVVGGIVIAMYMPIFSLISKLGQN